MNSVEDKSWDDSLKNLVDANPQAFVAWLFGKGGCTVCVISFGSRPTIRKY